MQVEEECIATLHHAEIALFLSSPNYGARVLIGLTSEKGYSLQFAMWGMGISMQTVVEFHNVLSEIQ